MARRSKKIKFAPYVVTCPRCGHEHFTSRTYDNEVCRECEYDWGPEDGDVRPNK